MKNFSSEPVLAQNFADRLKVPALPASLVTAEAEWRRAVAARDEGQAKHVEAVQLQRSQKPGQPPSVSCAEVDGLGADLKELFAKEESTRIAFEAERRNYETATTAPLLNDLAALTEAIGEKVNEVDRLLDHGFRVEAEVRTARLKLPNSIIVRTRALRSHVEAMRRLLRSSQL